MYYLTDTDSRYYAGQDYSDPRIPVFKGHYTCALYFPTMEEALEYRNKHTLQYLNVTFKCEG